MIATLLRPCLWTCAVGLLLLCGCMGRPDIIVTDPAGRPIAGAVVTGISLSLDGQTASTDAKGHAAVPWALQETQWISVHKDGYLGSEPIASDTPRPIRITLRPILPPE